VIHGHTAISGRPAPAFPLRSGREPAAARIAAAAGGRRHDPVVDVPPGAPGNRDRLPQSVIVRGFRRDRVAAGARLMFRRWRASSAWPVFGGFPAVLSAALLLPEPRRPWESPMVEPDPGQIDGLLYTAAGRGFEPPHWPTLGELGVPNPPSRLPEIPRSPGSAPDLMARDGHGDASVADGQALGPVFGRPARRGRRVFGNAVGRRRVENGGLEQLGALLIRDGGKAHLSLATPQLDRAARPEARPCRRPGSGRGLSPPSRAGARPVRGADLPAWRDTSSACSTRAPLYCAWDGGSPCRPACPLERHPGAGPGRGRHEPPAAPRLLTKDREVVRTGSVVGCSSWPISRLSADGGRRSAHRRPPGGLGNAGVRGRCRRHRWRRRGRSYRDLPFPPG